MVNLPFDYRQVFRAMNENAVSFLLIGGLNYFLAHKPVTTQDIDLFIDDTPENRLACERALIQVDAQWGKFDDDWGPVEFKPQGWLTGQDVFCFLTKFGPVAIFLALPGVSAFTDARIRSISFVLDHDLQIQLHSARDLLECQLALPEAYRKAERVSYLRGILKNV